MYNFVKRFTNFEVERLAKLASIWPSAPGEGLHRPRAGQGLMQHLAAPLTEGIL